MGWNIGTLREIGGGAVDALRAFNDMAHGRKASFTLRSAYTLGMGVQTMMLGALMQYLYTGQAPQEMKDYFYPKNGRMTPDGKPDRFSIPGYYKDVASFSINPIQTAINKLNPIFSLANQAYTNRDYYGHIIYYSPKDNWAEAYGKWILGQTTPLSFRNVGRVNETGGDALDGALAFFGIQSAPGYITNPEKQESYQAKQDLRAYKSRVRYENKQRPQAQP